MKKRISIFFYSGAGNTHFIAKNIKTQLVKKGYSISFININSKTVQANDFTDDIYLIGFPVYDLSAPLLVKELVRKLESTNQSVAYFCTKAFLSADSIFELKQITDKKGLRTVAALDLYMPATDALALFSKKGSVTERLLKSFHSKRIHQKITHFVNAIEKNKPIEISKKYYGYLAFLLPKKTRKAFHDQYTKYIPLLHSEEEICTQCMLCVKQCPRENIRLDQAIKFNLNCDMCLKCLHHCPVEAIQLGNYTKGNVRYKKVIVSDK